LLASGAYMTIPIVYPSSYPWEQIIGRQRFLMESLSELHPVIFLSGPEWKGGKLEVLQPSIQKVNSNLTIVRNSFGLRFSSIGRRLGKYGPAIDAAWLKSIFSQLGVKEYVLFLGAPEPSLMLGLDTSRLVFDCIDPCFVEANAAAFDAQEAGIAKQAKLVLCTAETLHIKMQKLNGNAHLVPNAAEANLFETQDKEVPLPAALQGRNRPFVGCLSTMDWRFAPEPITYAAKLLPEYTFVLAGRVNRDQEERMAELRGMPNVVMPGSVPFEEGPNYNANFDVGLIPFTTGPINDAINSVKMYMYLMGGKPVVSTWLRECVRLQPLVTPTKTNEEFADAIRREITENSPEKIAARIEFARKNTWANRAEDALRLIESSGLLQ
jgi:hypothetical protein